LTSGGNKFNDFPENQMTNFMQAQPETTEYTVSINMQDKRSRLQTHVNER